VSLGCATEIYYLSFSFIIELLTGMSVRVIGHFDLHTNRSRLEELIISVVHARQETAIDSTIFNSVVNDYS
jgi:hypothetical protein